MVSGDPVALPMSSDGQLINGRLPGPDLDFPVCVPPVTLTRDYAGNARVGIARAHVHRQIDKWLWQSFVSLGCLGTEAWLV